MPMNCDQGVIQYMIQPGDTLWDLAGEYGTTVEELMAANPYVDPYNLFIGQVISIPDPPEFRRPFGGPFRFRRPFFRRPFREFEEFREFRRRPFREFEEEEEEEERERFRRRPFR